MEKTFLTLRMAKVSEQLFLVTDDKYYDKDGTFLSPQAVKCTPGSSGSFPTELVLYCQEINSVETDC